MNPEIEQLKEDIKKLQEQMKFLTAEASIPYDVAEAFRERLRIRYILDLPTEFSSLPLTAITAPSGGATVDSQARSAINDIITRLEDAGIVSDN